MNIQITGFCWKCGKQCKDLFCSKKCERLFFKKEKIENERVNKIGKRAGYGISGSTH